MGLREAASRAFSREKAGPHWWCGPAYGEDYRGLERIGEEKEDGESRRSRKSRKSRESRESREPRSPKLPAEQRRPKATPASALLTCGGA